jgi:hypothetical protein
MPCLFSFRGLMALLLQNTKVTETQEFRQSYGKLAPDPSDFDKIRVDIMCYRGTIADSSSQWFMDNDPCKLISNVLLAISDAPYSDVLDSLSRRGRHVAALDSSQNIEASANAILRNQVRNLVITWPHRTQSAYLLARKCKFLASRLRCMPVLTFSLIQGIEKRQAFIFDLQRLSSFSV